MQEILWRIGAVAILVFANGFFVAAEFALVTVRRSRIDELAAEGVVRAKHAARAIKHLDTYIAGTQIGITIASIGLGWIGEPALAKLLASLLSHISKTISLATVNNIAVAISFAFITLLHVLLGELVPKSLALQKPETISLAVAGPMAVIVEILRPLIWSLNSVGNWLLRIFGLEPAGELDAVHSPKELEILVGRSHAAGHLDEFERNILQRSFHFSETAVSEIMVPRSDMIALDLSKPTSEQMQLAADSQHTRLPVFDGDPDVMIGIIFVHEIFRLSQQGGQIDLRSLLRPALFVPESLSLEPLMGKFREKQTQLAIVIDEYGCVAGLVTLEDVVETVFGEMQDQNEEPSPSILKRLDGKITISGDTRLAELNNVLGWDLRDDESDTIAGFVMRKLGTVGKVGKEVKIPGGLLRITEVERNRILTLEFTPIHR
ncbi:MAG: hemolysin family protein [Proteobacteria bacterium]|nr:hemolysin family protein [Pseudomonadota bacterium]